MKTVFNDVWENFNVHELGDVMTQTIHTYVNEWRSRNAEFGKGPDTKDLIETPDPIGEGMERFLAEFSGISFQNLSFRYVWASLTPETQPFISRKVLVTNGRVREFKDLSVINYAYWIIGDRKFLLSRKRTRNIGDLATKWRTSLVNASINWANDPASIVLAQAAKDYDEDRQRRNPANFLNNPNKDYYFIGPTGPGDALVFSSPTPERSRPPRQLTLQEAWSRNK